MQAENMIVVLWQLTVAFGILKLNTFPITLLLTDLAAWPFFAVQ
jgi:hypothetical protein